MSMKTVEKPKNSEAQPQNHFLVHIEFTDGEHEYNEKILLPTPNTDGWQAAREYLKTIFGEKETIPDEDDENIFWSKWQERKVSLCDVIKLSEEHYKVLKYYISEL